MNQTEESIQKFLAAIKEQPFSKDLTREQIIALLNHQPKNEVEISYVSKVHDTWQLRNNMCVIQFCGR